MSVEPNSFETSGIPVCTVDDLIAESGVCALINGRQVALFYFPDRERVYAIDNFDPVGRANVLSRGLVGSTDERLFLASPLYKERYCLETGECLDNPEVVLDTWNTRLEDGQLLVDPRAVNHRLLRESA
ncbi:nitrite reductase small subunit NirD [Marinobacterium sp. YM272]|uniref:nitrite reductase small subunit NirD n=1 Tax=Marinobacterium sp. YM272 TaxID=3421654 RepID=UPI003D7F2DBC